jgi:hypothetical protein
MLDMCSVPPASATPESPSRTLCAALTTACRPDAHALLMVNAGVAVLEPGAAPDLAREIGPVSGGARVAEDQLVDRARSDARARERRARRKTTQLGGARCRQRAAEVADRRAHRAREQHPRCAHRPSTAVA